MAEVAQMAEIAPRMTVLVAVNDSPAAFAAAEVALAYAVRLGAQVHVVSVVAPALIPASGSDGDSATLIGRRETEADSILRHVVALGRKAGLVVLTSRRTGTVAAEILDEARTVAADLIVMALVDRPGHAVPKVGSHTMRVLEFASVPVLVVPGPAARGSDPASQR
jgi:nucleotide-binding universal stress UspA family protein